MRTIDTRERVLSGDREPAAGDIPQGQGRWLQLEDIHALFAANCLPCGQRLGWRPRAEGQQQAFGSRCIQKSRGVIWHGDLELLTAAPALTKMAAILGENIFVVDDSYYRPPGKPRPPHQLLKHAVWWTRIHPRDQDRIITIDKHRPQIVSPDDLDDCMWPEHLGELVPLRLFNPLLPRKAWLDATALRMARRVSPVCLHLAGAQEWIWFDTHQSVRRQLYDFVLSKFPNAHFYGGPDWTRIGICHDGEDRGWFWPVAPGNPEVVAAAAKYLLTIRQRPTTAAILPSGTMELNTANVRTLESK